MRSVAAPGALRRAGARLDPRNAVPWSPVPTWVLQEPSSCLLRQGRNLPIGSRVAGMRPQAPQGPNQPHEGPLHQRLPAPGDAGADVALARHQGRRPRDQGAVPPGQGLAREDQGVRPRRRRLLDDDRDAPVLRRHQQEGEERPARRLRPHGGRPPHLRARHPRGVPGSRRHLPRRGRGGRPRAAGPHGRWRGRLRHPEPVVPPQGERRDHRQRAAPADRRPGRPRLPRPRRRLRRRCDLPRQRSQGLRDPARLSDELLLLLPPRAEEEGLLLDQRQVRAQALRRPRDRRDQGGQGEVQPQVRPLPR